MFCKNLSLKFIFFVKIFKSKIYEPSSPEVVCCEVVRASSILSDTPWCTIDDSLADMSSPLAHFAEAAVQTDCFYIKCRCRCVGNRRLLCRRLAQLEENTNICF